MAVIIPKAARPADLRNVGRRPGRDSFFDKPEDLWEAFLEYIAWSDKHPIKVKELVKDKLATKLVNVPHSRPYTYGYFTLYLGVTESYFRQFRRDLKHRMYEDGGTKRRSTDELFETILEQIDAAIYHQKLEGASVGIFNAMIIARDLKLKEHTEHTGADGAPLQGAVINIHPVQAKVDEMLEKEDADETDTNGADAGATPTA